MGAVRRSLSIAREMIPTVDLVIKSCIRAGIGIGVLAAAPHLPHSDLVRFAGKFAIMLALIGLVGHAEGVFSKHVAAKLRIEAARIGWAIVYVALLAVSAITLLARDDETENGDMG